MQDTTFSRIQTTEHQTLENFATVLKLCAQINKNVYHQIPDCTYLLDITDTGDTLLQERLVSENNLILLETVKRAENVREQVKLANKQDDGSGYPHANQIQNKVPNQTDQESNAFERNKYGG